MENLPENILIEITRCSIGFHRPERGWEGDRGKKAKGERRQSAKGDDAETGRQRKA